MVSQNTADYIACVPTAHMGEPIRGSVRGVCCVCGAEVWISPTSQALMTRAVPVCLSCVPRQGIIVMAPGALEEVRAELRRREREGG